MKIFIFTADGRRHFWGDKRPLASLFFHGARRRPPSWSNAGRSRGHFLHNGSSQQQTLVGLFGPVEQSVDTNSPSHFLMRPGRHQNTTTLLRWNSSIPAASDSHTAALSHTPPCFPHVHAVAMTASVESVSPNTDDILTLRCISCKSIRLQLDDRQLGPVEWLQR